MPEAPEVINLADNLNNKLIGQKLLSIERVGGRYSTEKNRKAPSGWDEFVVNLKLEKVKSKGKFLYFTFEDTDLTIWFTFGLKGYIKEGSKNKVIEFTFEKNTYYFTDTMGYGTVKFSNSKKELKDKLSGLGPDVINDTICKNIFMKKKVLGKNIVDVLTNQKIISGIGNYLVAEIMYEAKINPDKNVEDLDDDKLNDLIKAIENVSRTSYLAGGSKNYGGNYICKVYMQEKDPLNNIVHKTKRKGGRTTHHVNF